MSQQGFTVQVYIENVTFSQNTGNALHPSVLIIDDSRASNLIQFSQCIFYREGTMRIHKIFHNNTQHRFTIQNCSFKEGISSALEIFVIVNEVYEVVNHQQDILITNCLFSDFSKSHNFSIFYVRQIPLLNNMFFQQKYEDSHCSPVAVTLKSCFFQNNKIPCSNFNMITTPTGKTECSLIFILYCTYKANYVSNGFIVLVQREELLSVEKYEELYKSNGNFPDMVKFFNTHFINNFIERNQYPFKAIVGTKRIFVSFCNCNF